MPTSPEPGHLTLKQRLRVALALGEAEAEAALRAGTAGVDAEAVAARAGVARREVERLLGSRTALERYRMNPNRLTREQLRQLPGLSEERVDTVLARRPYGSLAELEAATGLPQALLEELFELPPLVLRDAVTGRSRKLTLLPGASLGRGQPEPSELEVAPSPEARGAGAQRVTVVRDSEGFQRYLVSGSIEVWCRHGTPSAVVEALLEQQGLRITDRRPLVGYYRAELREPPEDQDRLRAVLERIDTLGRAPEILFAEPEQLGLDDFGPEPTRRASDFEEATVGSRSWNLEAIELEGGHALTRGTPKAVLLVVDSGLRLDHPDLSAALLPAWRELDLNFDTGVPPEETSPEERVIAHGTGVAGIAVGRAPFSHLGARGMAPGCPVLPIKISGAPLTQSYGLRAVALREALEYLQPGQRGVINLSWSTSGEHLGIREALVEASRRGFAIVTSAGNYRPGETQLPDAPHYPSGYAFHPGDTEEDVAERRKIKGLCSVAALNASGGKASYSYFGARSITLCAPGGEPGGGAGTALFLASTPENYAYGAGTSFAAPHVSGALALLFSLEPGLEAQRAIDILRETATPLEGRDPAHAGMLGAGQLNIRAALESLAGVPVGGGGAAGSGGTSGGEPGPALFDINTATAEELAALPLMGPWTAARIVAWRGAHGPFSSIQELTLTGVVDAWTVRQLKPWLTAGASPSLPHT